MLHKEGIRRKPFVRSTVTLLIPAVLLLVVLLLADVYQAHVTLLSSVDTDGEALHEALVEDNVVDAADTSGAAGENLAQGDQPPLDWANPQENAVEADEYVYEAPEPIPPKVKDEYPEEWMLEAKATMALVDSQSQRFRRKKAFDLTFDKLRHGFVVRFKDGNMYAVAKMLPGTEGVLGNWNDTMRQNREPPIELRQTLRALCHHGLIGDPKFNIDFVVSVPDEPVNTIDDGGVPAFGWVKTAYDTDLLIPYPYTFDSMYPLSIVQNRGSLNNLDDIDQYCYNESLAAVNNYWDAKIPKGIWRGSTTGVQRFTRDNWRDQARTKLVKYCMEHEDICDAAISGIVQAEEDAAEEMRQELLVGENYMMSSDEQGRFKYAIMMDGNSAPSSRTVTTLGQTSAILKQSSPFMEFYYHSLRPYVHYLPIPRDIGEDLSKVIEWARDHDDEVKQMVVRASTFRCRWLHDEIVQQYVVDLFDMYAERFRGIRGSIKTEDMIPIHINCGFNEY